MVKNRQRYIKQLDKVFSEYIRLRDCDAKGIVTCPLCKKKIFRRVAQNMHFISRGVLKYRFDECNCFAGCFRCNVMLNGNYIAYTLFMIDKFGLERVEQMKNDKSIFKIGIPELEKMIDYYKGRVEEYKKEKNLFG